MSSRITDVYLSVKEKRGKKKGKVETIWKGEFVTEIPERAQYSDRNYSLLRDPAITFHAEPTEVAPLNGSDYDYLSAVEHAHQRHQFYTSGRLAKAKKLIIHDEVFVHLEKVGMVRGAIRYVGALEGKSGVRFGIEIVDEKYRGKGTTDGKPNFVCGHRNAVYVAADRVVVPDPPSKPPKDGKSAPKPFREGIVTRSKAAGKEEPRVDSASGSTYFSRAREAISKYIWEPATVDPSPDHVPAEGYQFKCGDRVMMYTAKYNAVHGTVRWIGPIQFSKESNVDKPVAIAGIETDIPVDPEKDFPGIHVDLTGSHSHGGPFFSVKKTHGRIYIPEQLLEREPLEYGNLEDGFQNVNEEDQLAGQTAKNSISLNFTQDQIEEQKKQLMHYEMERAAKHLKRKDNAQQNLGGNSHSYPPTSQPRTSATVGNLSEGSNTNGSLHHGYSQKDSDAYQSKVYSERTQSDQPVSNAPGFSAHGTSSPQVPHLTTPSQYGAFSQQSSRFDSGGLGADSTQVDNPSSRELQPLSSQQQAESLLGAAVRVKTTPGTEGVIRWVGNLQDYTKGMVAGIELFQPMPGCTDGEHNGTRYFYCSPGRALFCPVSHVQILEDKQTSGGSTSGLRNWNTSKDTEFDNVKKRYMKQLEEISHELVLVKQSKLEMQKKYSGELSEANESIHHLEQHNGELRERLLRESQVNAHLQQRNVELENEMMQLRHEENDISFWVVPVSEVKLTDTNLGAGAYGKVQLGFFRGQKVAVKQLHNAISSTWYNQLLQREIAMMAKVRHPNLLLFIAAVIDHPSGSPLLITEVLDTSLRKAYEQKLLQNIQIKLDIMRDVASALNYLHHQKKPMIHRDVSSANVLLEARPYNGWRAKLSDFGSANVVSMATTAVPGAAVYTAPEVPRGIIGEEKKAQTVKVDVYSYGVLLCEVLTNCFPEPTKFSQMLESVDYSLKLPLMYAVIKNCIKRDPTQRPTMDHILEQIHELLDK